MTNSDHSWEPPPWEPPIAGTEAEHLVGALERLGTTFRWKADDLGAGLQTLPAHRARRPAPRGGGRSGR